MKPNVLQIIPAPTGTRMLVVNYTGGTAESLEAKTDDDLVSVHPVACFALLEDDEGQTVIPVAMSDMGCPITFLAESFEEECIAILAPGEDPSSHTRAQAIGRILQLELAKSFAVKDVAAA